MNAIKKTVLATAVLMSMGVGAAQAATANYSFTGAFVMFDGYDPTFSNPVNVVDNGNGIAGDPITGFMHIDTTTGAGTAEMTPGSLFFGSAWAAHDITLQATANPGEVNAAMLFDWNGNNNIGVTVTFQMFPTANPMVSGFFTTQSSMPAGPFAGFQPTFNGEATFTGITGNAAVPVPAAAWLLGSGLLGLVGVARRKAA